jgi:flagellar hook-basal body complex protein FliE
VTALRSINPAQVAAAYRTGGAAETAAAATGGGGFGAALQRAVEGAVEAGHAADASGVRALSGQGGVSDVVLAVSRPSWPCKPRWRCGTAWFPRTRT